MHLFCQPEIQQLGVTAIGHKDVRRFEVPVDDASFMGRFKSIGDL
jgi:hypothetical protein